MNYYNPYFYTMPTVSNATGLSGLFSKLNFSSIVSGTSKTLNLVNQAIPIFRQVSPMVKNAKTMFKVMNEFKKTDTSVSTEETVNSQGSINNESTINTYSKNMPTFFA